MHQFSGIFLHMNFMNTNGFLTRCSFDLHPAVPADWQIQLGNLVILRIIRIKIVFTVKLAILCNAAVSGKTNCNRILYHLFI